MDAPKGPLLRTGWFIHPFRRPVPTAGGPWLGGGGAVISAGAGYVRLIGGLWGPYGRLL
jgi:hypothetical protein